MAGGLYGAATRHIHGLFEAGSTTGLPEWQLLRRFTVHRDESAFEALVARHGPMVLGVCRRVLDDPHTVDDAFQATFLVLVRKASALGERDAIGHWLYGVAHRVALRARCETARRRAVEALGAPAEPTGCDDAPERTELSAVVDDELSRLPAKYRSPIVLCYLEGLTHEEAARRLGWPVGTVKGRLARAKNLLRGRLARRGLAPSATALAATLGRDASAAVPDALIRVTVQAALRLSAGGAAAGGLSAAAVRLMEGVLSAMFATKIKAVATILGTCTGLALGAWAMGQAESTTRARTSDRPARGQSTAERRESTPGAHRKQTVVELLRQPLPLSFKEAPLEDVLKFIKSATAGPNDAGLPIYVEPEGLEQTGATMTSRVSAVSKTAPLADSLDQMLRPLKLGAAERDGLLVISSRPEITLIELRKLNDQLARRERRQSDRSETDDAVESSPASWLRRLEGPRERRPVYYASEASGDELAGAETDAKTRAILEALRRPIPIEYAKETPLEDVLRDIQEKTKGKELPQGIPIYADPAGFEEAERTMSSAVQLDLRDVPLSIALRLLLRQLELTYFVKSGLLTITSPNEEPNSNPLDILAEKAERGELSIAEMKALLQVFQLRAHVKRYAEGFESDQDRVEFERSISTSRASQAPQAGATTAPQPSPPAQREEDDEQTKAIRSALDQVVPLEFKDASLETVVKEIQKKTVGAELPDGIPVYLDPNWRRLSQVSNPPEPKVDFEQKGIKLKTSLRLMLSQLGLAYTVKEGLLIIGYPGSSELGGIGGMGGIGGGMGGGFR